VPERLRRLVLRGLSVAPDDRYADLDALLTELRELRAGLEALAFAPTQQLEHDPDYDTRAIERALGLPSSNAPSSGRPKLSAAELGEIAEELGLELAGPPQRATHEPSHEAPEPAALERSLPEQTHHGLPVTILAERMLPALPDHETQRRIVRELERNLGGTGIVEQFEAGMAWANKQAEASLDRTQGGARLTLRRSFAKLARKRRRRGLILGGFLGTIFGGIVLDALFPFAGAIEPLVVFSGTALGMLLGTKLARSIHARQMHEERAVLGWIGERIESLVAAQAPKAPKALAPAKRSEP
jgi:hypothetical protein